MEYEGIVNRYKDDSCRLRLKVLVMKCKGEFRARAEKESDIHSEKESGERIEQLAATSTDKFKVLCGSLRIGLVRKEVCLQILVRY